MTKKSNIYVDIVNYKDDFEEEYLYIHNNGFTREETLYDNRIETYNEEGNIAITFLAKYEGDFVGLIDLVKMEGRDDIFEINPIAVYYR